MIYMFDVWLHFLCDSWFSTLSFMCLAWFVCVFKRCFVCRCIIYVGWSSFPPILFVLDDNPAPPVFMLDDDFPLLAFYYFLTLSTPFSIYFLKPTVVLAVTVQFPMALPPSGIWTAVCLDVPKHSGESRLYYLAGHKMVRKWSRTEHELVTNCSQIYDKLVTNWSQTGHKPVTNLSRTGHKLVNP